MENPLTKASEKRILDALEKVAALTNTGMHPNDAITKVASDDKIPAGHIRLMVNAVNTGRTNSQRMTGSDLFEKSAEFPLADVATVLEALYPATVHTKAAAHFQTAVADEYRRSPAWLKEKAAQEKAARAVDWKLTDKKPVIERDPDYVLKRAAGHLQKLHQQLEQQRMELTRHRESAMKLATELREYFKKPGHIRFDEVTENSSLMLGKAASAVLSIVKPAKEIGAAYTSTPVDIHKAPYSLIKKAIDTAKTFKASQEAYDAAVKSANDEARKLLRPFGPGPAQGRSVMEDQCWQPETKLAGLGSFLAKGFGLMTANDIAKEVARKMPGSQTSPDLEKKDLQKLLDPAHESEIRNIQAEALLNDLMANDEVIKGYDPEEVIDAFNESSQLAPYAANKKAIMRDLMRKRLAGGPAGLDSFAISDTLNQQEKLRNMSYPAKDQVSTMQDFGVFPNGHSIKSVLSR